MTRTMTSRFLFPLALGLALFGPPGGLTAQTPVGTPDRGLQPGDIVQVTVWQRGELSGEFTVALDGSLLHPLYRQVRVTGVPASQIEERLRSFLSAYEANPLVVVQPLYRVTVVGSVMSPGIYKVASGTTVTQAVNEAGGVTENGKRDDVRLFRGVNETRLDLTEPEAIGMPVESGDQILVKNKSSGGIRRFILPVIQIGFSIANLLYR